jgi:hypothetical protein
MPLNPTELSPKRTRKKPSRSQSPRKIQSLRRSSKVSKIKKELEFYLYYNK